METKFKEAVEKFRKSDKKIKAAVIIGLIGILLLGISELTPKRSNNSEKQQTSYSDYTNDLEEKTEKIISSIEGVGKCNVMITLKNSNESVFAKNIQQNSENGNYSSQSEYVLYNGQNGETPVLIKEFFPEIKGVAVVCSGADSIAVREEIIKCISSLYGISSAKISVSKMRG